MLMTSLATFFAQLLVQVAGANSPHLFQIVFGVILLGLIYARFVGGPWPALRLPLTVTVDAGDAHSGHRYGIWRLAALAPVTVAGARRPSRRQSPACVCFSPCNLLPVIRTP